MEISEVRVVAQTGWRRQLIRCVFSALLISVLLIISASRSLSLPPILIAPLLILSVGYFAEWTWNEWRQKRFLMALTAPLTLDQFRLLRAQEQRHTAVRTCIFVFLCFGFVFWLMQSMSQMAFGSTSLTLLLFCSALAPCISRVVQTNRAVRRVLLR